MRRRGERMGERGAKLRKRRRTRDGKKEQKGEIRTQVDGNSGEKENQYFKLNKNATPTAPRGTNPRKRTERENT